MPSNPHRSIESTTKPSNIFSSLGCTKTVLLEIVLFFAAFMAVDYALLSGNLNDFSPHPFWIPVILISAQHGIAGGLITAIAAIGLSQYIGWPAHTAHEDYYEYLIRAWSTPAFWLGTVIVLGELRQRHIAERTQIQGELQRFDEERKVVSNHCRSLQTTVEDLEHRIATTQTHSISPLFEQLEALKHLDESNIALELPPIMEALFGPAAFSLYGFGDLGHRVVLARSANSDDNPMGQPIALSHNLHHMLAANGRCLSVLNPIEAEALGGNALFAAPLKNQKNGRTFAILKIDTLTPEMATKRTEQLFRIFCSELETVMSGQQLVTEIAPLEERSWPRLVDEEHSTEMNA